ncbi:hypothetical protein ANO11243_026990 [Dothideomycetidae sp. 11243]|nr:hypothetical protein ANO11243_026990 [fungal sp. No.11243]
MTYWHEEWANRARQASKQAEENRPLGVPRSAVPGPIGKLERRSRVILLQRLNSAMPDDISLSCLCTTSGNRHTMILNSLDGNAATHSPCIDTTQFRTATMSSEEMSTALSLINSANSEVPVTDDLVLADAHLHSIVSSEQKELLTKIKQVLVDSRFWHDTDPTFGPLAQNYLEIREIEGDTDLWSGATCSQVRKILDIITGVNQMPEGHKVMRVFLTGFKNGLEIEPCHRNLAVEPSYLLSALRKAVNCNVVLIDRCSALTKEISRLVHTGSAAGSGISIIDGLVSNVATSSQLWSDAARQMEEELTKVEEKHKRSIERARERFDSVGSGFLEENSRLREIVSKKDDEINRIKAVSAATDLVRSGEMIEGMQKDYEIEKLKVDADKVAKSHEVQLRDAQRTINALETSTDALNVAKRSLRNDLEAAIASRDHAFQIISLANGYLISYDSGRTGSVPDDSARGANILDLADKAIKLGRWEQRLNVLSRQMNAEGETNRLAHAENTRHMEQQQREVEEREKRLDAYEADIYERAAIVRLTPDELARWGNLAKAERDFRKRNNRLRQLEMQMELHLQTERGPLLPYEDVDMTDYADTGTDSTDASTDSASSIADPAAETGA